jgi:hypothetical protein
LHAVGSLAIAWVFLRTGAGCNYLGIKDVPTPEDAAVDGAAPGIDAAAEAAPEASTADAPGPGSDAQPESGVPDGGVPQTYLGVAAQPDMRIKAMTSDGYVVFYDGQSTYDAVFDQADGGAPISISSFASGHTGFAHAFGSIVITWDAAQTSSGNLVGPLTLWSSQMSPTKISTSSVADQVAVSTTGDAFIYIEATSADGATGDLYGIHGDGSGKTLLVSGAEIASMNTTCTTSAGIRNGFAFVGSCSAADGGAQAATLETFRTSDWSSQAAILTNGAGYYDMDSQATFVVAMTTAQQLQVFPISGGSPLQVDPSTTFAAPQVVVLSQGQSGPPFVLYTNASGQLWQSPIPTTASPSPTPLQIAPSPVVNINALSPDQKWATYYGSTGNDGFPTSMNLVSTSVAGTANLASAQLVAQQGDAFTTDGQWVLFEVNLQEQTTFWAGSTFARQTGSGGSTVTISNGLSGTTRAAGASKIVYLDNLDVNTQTQTLSVRDLGSSNPPIVLASGLQPDIAMPPDTSKVAYLNTTGIFVSPVP